MHKKFQPEFQGFYAFGPYLCIAVFVFSLSGAFYLWWNQKPEDSTEILLAAEPAVCDFGEVSESVHHAVVKLRNVSKWPLYTFHVVSSCSCTEANLPRTEIKPGETIDLKLAFDTLGRNGITKGNVAVAFAKDGDYPRFPRYLMIDIRADVTPNIF